MSKILIVDDDELLGTQVADALCEQKYLIDIARTMLEADIYLKTAAYDLIILDWVLPDGSGPEICSKIRSSKIANVPILFLTARAEIVDKKEGFDRGADDYLTKPFHMIELVARVKSLLKRPPAIQSRQLKVRNIVLDIDKHEVYVDGEQIELFPKEFSLLQFFISNPNRIFSADDLLRHLWSTDSESSAETVRVTIMRIRQKLKLSTERPLIVTLRNIGYRLEP